MVEFQSPESLQDLADRPGANEHFWFASAVPFDFNMQRTTASQSDRARSRVIVLGRWASARISCHRHGTPHGDEG